jgi:hypothetical protein
MKKTLLIFRNRNNIMQSLGLDIETEYAISKNDSIRLTVYYLDSKFKTLKIFTNITVDGTAATEQVLDGNRPVQACRPT